MCWSQPSTGECSWPFTVLFYSCLSISTQTVWTLTTSKILFHCRSRANRKVTWKWKHSLHHMYVESIYALQSFPSCLFMNSRHSIFYVLLLVVPHLNKMNINISPVCRPHSQSFTCCPLQRMTAVSAPSLSLQTPAAAPQTTSPITTRLRRAACQQEQRRLLNSPLSPSVPISHLLPGAWMRKRRMGRKRGRRRRIRAFVPQKQKENMKMKVSRPTSQSGQIRNVVRGSLRVRGSRSLFHRVKVKFKLLYIIIVLQHIHDMLPTQVAQNPSNLRSSTPSMTSAWPPARQCELPHHKTSLRNTKRSWKHPPGL